MTESGRVYFAAERLVIVLMEAAVTRMVTHLSSSGIYILFLLRLGSQRRRVWRLEWETLLPVDGPTPENSQRFDICSNSLEFYGSRDNTKNTPLFQGDFYTRKTCF